MVWHIKLIVKKKKKIVLLYVHAALFHAMEVNGGQGLSGSKKLQKAS